MFIKQLLCFLHIFSSRLFSNKPSITQMILGKIKANQRTPLHVPWFETCWLSWANTDFQEPLVCFLVVETESREILGKFPRNPSRGLSHFATNRNVSQSDSSRASVRRDTQVRSPCQRVQLKESQSCVQVAMLASSVLGKETSPGIYAKGQGCVLCLSETASCCPFVTGVFRRVLVLYLVLRSGPLLSVQMP